MSRKLYIFDLDHTLLAVDSNTVWNQYLLDNHIITNCQFPQQEQQLIEDYEQGCMDIQQFIRFIMQPVSHLSVDEMDTLLWRCIDQRILPKVYPQASALLNQLQQQGHTTLIISATASFLVNKIARRLGVKHAIGIDLTLHQQPGQPAYYGMEIAGVASYQQGKVTRLQHWLNDHPQLAGESWFYTDSINDLPLCLHADHVCLVNPCQKLREYNQQRHWPVLHWRLPAQN